MVAHDYRAEAIRCSRCHQEGGERDDDVHLVATPRPVPPLKPKPTQATGTTMTPSLTTGSP